MHGQVGAHWRPWRGGFLDAGATYRIHFANYEPQFGGLAPTSQGDDRILDFSFAQRVLPHLYVMGSFTDRTGEANEYKRVTFGRNAPAAPANTPLTTNRTFPTPGSYFDDGTALRESYEFCQIARNYRHLLTGSVRESLPTDPWEAERLGRMLGYIASPQTMLRDDYRRLTRHARTVVESVFYGRESATPPPTSA